MSDAMARIQVHDLNELADAVTKGALAGRINHVRIGRRMTRFERASAHIANRLSNEALAFGAGVAVAVTTLVAIERLRR